MIPTVGDKVVISMVSGRQYNGEIIEADTVHVGIKQFWSGDVVYVERCWIESQEKINR